MSIWCSSATIGYDQIFPRKNGKPARGEVRSYATGWSNHYPTTDGEVEQPANVDIASIPVWCVPGHRAEMTDEFGPWMRLSVDTVKHSFNGGGASTGQRVTADVVMDERAVRALVKDMKAWLARPKVHPVAESVGATS